MWSHQEVWSHRKAGSGRTTKTSLVKFSAPSVPNAPSHPLCIFSWTEICFCLFFRLEESCSPIAHLLAELLDGYAVVHSGYVCKEL